LCQELDSNDCRIEVSDKAREGGCHQGGFVVCAGHASNGGHLVLEDLDFGRLRLSDEATKESKCLQDSSDSDGDASEPVVVAESATKAERATAQGMSPNSSVIAQQLLHAARSIGANMCAIRKLNQMDVRQF
jgi:hypothetical protein